MVTIIKDPLAANAPFPGNIIPTGRISPITLKLQQYFPSPNLPGSGGYASDFSVAVPTTVSTNQTLDRIDQNIGDKIRLFARAYHQVQPAYGGNSVPVDASTTPYHHEQLQGGLHPHPDPEFGERFPRGPALLRLSTSTRSPRPRTRTRVPLWGFPASMAIPHMPTPAFRISTSRVSTDFNESGTNWYQDDSTIQFSEQISWNHGSHNVVAGLDSAACPPAARR